MFGDNRQIMKLVDKILYKISSILTRKRLVKIIDRYGHRFVVFRNKKLKSDDIFMFFVSLKEEKEFLGIRYWSYYTVGTFLGYENKQFSNAGLEGRFVYSSSGREHGPSFLLEKIDYDLAMEKILKYKISKDLGLSQEDCIDFKNSEKIDSHYKSYTREARLSVILDKS